ncbi:MAG: Ig-like domain-containing protein, partial [Proteobacteria bacterium]|nr:Ig-like domain-containing protein [Pseudomonadota bacterium]
SWLLLPIGLLLRRRRTALLLSTVALAACNKGFTPEEGAWSVIEADIQSNDCGFEPATPMETFNLGLGVKDVFAMTRSDGYMVKCELDYMAFSCDDSRESFETDEYNDADWYIDWKISGEFVSETELGAAVLSPYRCDGMDCEALGYVLDLDFPCDIEVDIEAELGPPPEVVNEAPTANPDTASCFGQGVDIMVLENDTDPEDDKLTITGVTQGTIGSVTNNGSSVSYVPNDPQASGDDTFTYTIEDEAGNEATGTVTVAISAPPTLVIVSPLDNDIVVGPDVPIAVDVNGCTVSYPSQNADGCHTHFYVDTIYNASAYTTAPVVLTKLSPGPHTLEAVLKQNHGSCSSWVPVVDDSVDITVIEPDTDTDTDTDTDETGHTGGTGFIIETGETGLIDTAETAIIIDTGDTDVDT